MKRSLLAAAALLLLAAVAFAQDDAKYERYALEAYRAIVPMLNAGKQIQGDAVVFLPGVRGAQKQTGECTGTVANDYITVASTVNGEKQPVLKGKLGGFRLVTAKMPLSLKGSWSVAGHAAGDFSIRIIGCQDVLLTLGAQGKKYELVYRLKSTVSVADALYAAKSKIDKAEGIVDPLAGKPAAIRQETLGEGEEVDAFTVFTKDGKVGVAFQNEKDCISNLYDEFTGASLWDYLYFATSPRGVELVELSYNKAQRALSRGFFPCQAASPVTVNPGVINYCSVKLDGKWGLVNKDLELVIQPGYEAPFSCLDPLDFEGGFVAKKNGQFGIIDLNERTMLPFEYDLIYPGQVSEFERYFLFFKGSYSGCDANGSPVNASGRWGIIINGKVIRDCTLASEQEAIAIAERTIKESR